VRERERTQVKEKSHFETIQLDGAIGCWLEQPKRLPVLSNHLLRYFFHSLL